MTAVFDWKKILYGIIVLLLYIPMVYLGANVFFTEYNWPDDYYRGKDCYLQYPNPVDARVDQSQVAREQCVRDEEKERQVFEKEKRTYDGWKYVVITLINLTVMLVAIFVPLDSSIIYGLFSGAVLTTFTSTWIYFASRSKIGFGLLVAIFILCVWFINKQRKAGKCSRKR